MISTMPRIYDDETGMARIALCPLPISLMYTQKSWGLIHENNGLI